MSDQNDVSNKDIRPYGAIEETNIEAQKMNRHQSQSPVDDSIITTPPPDLSGPEHPSAKSIAEGFSKFNPVNYLRKYRAAMWDYYNNLQSSQLDVREQAYEQEINREVRNTKDWQDRLARMLTWLAPLATMLGPNRGRVGALLGSLGIIPLIVLVVLVLGVCLCVGGWMLPRIIGP